MGQALYRKYRSKSLAEIIGQQHITTTLQNALKKGRVSHAYLFTGPRGVGKTSIARILAHEVNALPYVEGHMHLDIIEIDAASNRGIEEIRDLRDKMNNAPTSAKYKVYIIDEVHMLTKQAFNALLKTLEEPPAHVIFILATTESHKLPETIVSRTQRFTFKPIDRLQVTDHLRKIADQEGIIITDEALGLIAAHGDGSFRDSISLLDQASSSAKKITAEIVTGILGIPSAAAIEKLIKILESGTPQDLLLCMRELEEQGIQPSIIARQLGVNLRQMVADGNISSSPEAVMHLLYQLLAVPAAPDPVSMLEVTLLSYALSDQPGEKPRVSSKPPEVVQQADTIKKKPEPAHPEVATVKHRANRKTTAEPEPMQPLPSATKSAIIDVWPQILATVRKRHNTLYGILRMAQPAMDGDSITLAFAYAFHQKKMNEDKSKALLREIISDIMGADFKVTCTVEKSAVPPKLPASHGIQAASVAADDSLDAITSVFGGAEVLDS